MLSRKYPLTFFTRLRSHKTCGRWADILDASDEYVNNSKKVMVHPHMVLPVSSFQGTGELTETFVGQSPTLCDLTRVLFTLALLSGLRVLHSLHKHTRCLSRRQRSASYGINLSDNTTSS